MSTPAPLQSTRTLAALASAAVLAMSSLIVAGGAPAGAVSQPPAVTGVSPTTGASTGGTTVRIDGTNLQSATAVKFGATSATFSFVAPPAQRPSGGVSPRGLIPGGYINATAPAGTPGAAVHITVTNLGGTSSTSASDVFTYNALAPAAPTITSAASAPGGVAVAWTDGATNGSSITSYTLRAYDGVNLAATKSNCSSSPCSITGLTNGTSYTVTVTATNGVGEGSASTASSAVVPAALPAAPTVTTATPTDGGVSVAWTDGASNGSSIISHTLRAYSGASLIATKTDCSSSPCSITGLTNGTSYTVTVTATNGVGEGSASTASSAVTPRTIAGAPAQVSAVAGAAQAVVSWNPPTETGGDPVTSYVITAIDGTNLSAGGQTCTYTVSTPETDTCTVTGLTNGDSYTFTGVSVNHAGSSSPSTASSAVTPVDVPAAPTAASATAGDAQATVSWTDGTSNGSTITSWTVRAYAGSTLVSTTTSCISSPCVITDLTNGTTITFTVSATNGVGEGSASSASSAVTPIGEGWVLIDGTWFAPGSDHSGTDFSGKDLSTNVFPAAVDLSGSDFSNATLDGTDLSATILDGSTGCGISGTPILPTGWFLVGACLVTLPGAPATASGESDHTQVMVSWTPPTSDGGLPISSYVATVTGNPALTCTYTVPTAPTPEVDQCLITGLADGTSYTFDVVAHTAAGDGPAITTDTVIPATYIDGYAIYPGADLQGANLAGADLHGLNLSGTNLNGANLAGADLTATGLYLTDFTAADLSGADLSGLDLQHVTLSDDGPIGANLSGADLTGDNLTSLDLTSVNFTGAKLGNATFGHIDDDESDEASRSEVNFTNAYLVGATFGFDHTPADITGWTFAGADLTGVSLAHADLTMSNMSGANLTNTDLSGAVLNGVNLTGATVAGTVLGTATLSGLMSSGLVGAPASLPSGWYVVSGSIRQVMEPQSPSVVTVTPGYGSVDVSWTIPGDNGGAPITSYRASVIGDDSLACTYTVPVGVEQDTCTISGLAAGTTYGIQVVATNSVGLNSSPTWSDPVTTLVPAPVFTSASSAVFVRGQLGSFTVSADLANSMSLSGTLPKRLRFHDNGDGTATISGRPDRDQSTLSTTLTITATGEGSATQDLTIIVAKRAQILIQRGSRWAGWFHHRLQFKVGSTIGAKVEVDAGGYVAPISVTGLPGWATFHDNGDGTGSITGSPSSADVGTSVLVFRVDGLPNTATKQLIVTATGQGSSTTTSTTLP